MRVYLAAQTFNATVATGIENYLEFYPNFDDILSEIPDPSNKEIQNTMFPEKSPFKFKTALPIGSVDYRDLSLPSTRSKFINRCLWLFNEKEEGGAMCKQCFLIQAINMQNPK
ncbi:hypothetical protein QTP88_004768 [Uroleucon formosanum]